MLTFTKLLQMRILAAIFLIAGLMHSENASAYCVPSAGGNGLYDLSEFYLESISLPNYDATYGSNDYVDHTGSYTTQLIPGETYYLEAHHVSGCCQLGVGVWVDWYQDGSWNTSHAVYLSQGDPYDDSNPVQLTFTVPGNAVPGHTRLRYGWARDTGPNADDYCQAWNSPTLYSGYRDFGIEILSLDPPQASFYLPDTLYTGSNNLINASNAMDFWDFEWLVDGSPTSTNKEFTFTPSTSGQYAITLNVEADGNTDSETKYTYVKDPDGPPVANFIANRNLLFMGDSVRFSDLTTQAPDTWQWEVTPETTQIDPDPNFPPQPTHEFSQGYNSGSQHPYITFHYPGVYDVSLTASRDQHSDTEDKPEYITVSYPLGIIFEVMEETDEPSGAFTDDGGGESYGDNEGSFLIAPCSDDLYIVFDEFELECGTDHLRIYDGTSDSTGTPLYADCSTNGFTGGGDQDGCDASDICLPPDTLFSETGRFYIEYEGGSNSENLQGFIGRWGSKAKYAPPEASFEAPETACVGDEIEFTNTSTGAGIVSYKWDYFGSGIVADTTEHGSFEYQTATTYHPMLIVEDCAGLIDTFQHEIEVLDPVEPSNFDLEADNYEPWANEDVVTLSADAQQCISDFEWSISPASYSFAEGSDQFSRNPEVIFHQPGCYEVQLIASNDDGSGIVTETCLIEARGYCTPVVGQTSEDIGVSRVIVGDIDHTSPLGESAYSNFSDEHTTDLRKGETYQITVQRQTTANSMDRAIWIDWNQNGSFDDTLELVAYESNARTASYTASFTVPGLAGEGRSRLRIGTGFGGNTLNSCGGQFIGEFVDYGVNILPAIDEPEITLHGDNPLHIEVYSAFTEPGYDAWDDAYGDLTDQVDVDESDVDTAQLGTYTVTYTVSDGDGNTAQKEREVIVEDTLDPTIELVSDDTLTLEVNTQFSDPGVDIEDNYWTNLDANISSNLDETELGIYEVEYCVTDGSGNGPVCVTRVVEVVDTTPPEIILPSDTIVTEVLEPVDFGTVQISDNYWADDELDVEFSGIDDVPDELGNFTVTITATDGSDNTGDATVIVRVVDTTPPVIELNGSAYVNVRINSAFDDPWVSVDDNFDPEPEVIVGGNFDGTDEAGLFFRTYYAVDQSGNESETVERTIFVDPAISIAEEDDYNVSIYPNPATSHVDVSVTGLNNFSIEVSDLTGRTLMEVSSDAISGSEHRIDMQDYAEGIYLIRISNDDHAILNRVNVVR